MHDHKNIQVFSSAEVTVERSSKKEMKYAYTLKNNDVLEFNSVN